MAGKEYLDKEKLASKSVAELKRLKDTYGMNLFIDCTPVNIGRNIDLLKKISKESSVHIVCSTGFYYTDEPVLYNMSEETLLALHAVRRDTNKPGIYGYVVDFSHRKWEIVDELLLWEPTAPMQKDTKMAEIFSFLKFGQPVAILLKNGEVMMSHWFAENGRYKTVATRIVL